MFDFGPLALDVAGTTTNYRDLGNANRVQSALALTGGRHGWRVEAGPVLWSGANPWLDAWQVYTGAAGLAPMVVPYGEFGDLDALNAQEALDGGGHLGGRPQIRTLTNIIAAAPISAYISGISLS